MIQKVDSLIKVFFILLIILLIATLALTSYSTYKIDQALNSFSENKGEYVFDVD